MSFDSESLPSYTCIQNTLRAQTTYHSICLIVSKISYMKNFILLLLALPFFSNGQSIFDDFDDFISSEVVFGLVNYGKIKESPGQLDELLLKIAAHTPADSSVDYQTAFYINVYNILVIKQVVDNYPINSPMDVEGFFKEKKFRVAGELLTLDQIEFEKLIEPTKDPRIHFALGCGARSCPYLFNNAFYPDQLQDQLAFRASDIIERPNYVFMENAKKTVTLNKIFDWYGDQFKEVDGTLIKYINRYKSQKVPEVYLVRFQEYDWSLNDLDE